MERLSHRRCCRPRGAARLAALLLVCGGGAARGDVFDLTLARLVKQPAGGAAADPSTDPAALAAYRQLHSELGVALAPRFLTPADTLGWSGFQLDIDYSFTSIASGGCADPGTAAAPAHQDQCPWAFGVDGGRDGAGNRTLPPNLMHTVSLHARKGIWLPLPSLELGVGATKLLGSSLYSLEVYAQLGLHEGFRDLPIPSLALRASGARVMGDSQIDLTMAQLDLSLSKRFGVAGTLALEPYLGAAWLLLIARPQVLDLTPAHDAFRDGPNSVDLNNNAVFPASANENITRWRFFAGLKLAYDVLVLTTSVVATMCGDFDGSCPAYGAHKGGGVPDNSQTQVTFSLAAGFGF